MSSAKLPLQTHADRSQAGDARVIASVAEAISRLRYGSIALTVHDGKVVQLDVTERKRFA